jgi:hypothetical protein
MFVHLIQALGRRRRSSWRLIYFWFPALLIGRGVILLTSVIVIGTLASWRAGLSWLGRRMKPRERLLLVGTSQAAIRPGSRNVRAARRARRRHSSAFIDPDPGRLGAPVLNPRVIGTVEDIPVDRPRPRASIAWSSASPTRAASCRWTSCSR